jgi:hypothetical protein
MILQEEGDSIILEIDNETKFSTKALFSFVNSDGNEILSFEGDNKILFYQLHDGLLIHSIHLQKEGPNGVGTVFGHYPLSLDSVYITRRNTPELYLVNSNGNVLDKYNYLYDINEELCTHTISSTIVYSPLIKIGHKIFLNQFLLEGGNTTGDILEKNPVSIVIDEYTKKVNKLPFTYPRLWEGVNDFAFAEYSRIFDGKRFVYSFFWDENIYITNIEHTEVKKISAKSRYISELNKKLKRPNNFQQGIKMSIETAKYGNLVFDPYREVYYRFAFPQTELKTTEDIQVVSLFRKVFSIIILNKDLEVIGETSFEENTFVPFLFFISKKGLYISNNHINNPFFDENKIAFKRFSLLNK